MARTKDMMFFPGVASRKVLVGPRQADWEWFVNIRSVPRMRRNTTSAFTRVLDALWWCAAKPGAQRETGRLGNAVGADHGGTAQAPDRGHDHHRAVAALGHLRDRLRAEPDVALDVGGHDLVEGLVLDVEQRAIIGIHRG